MNIPDTNDQILTLTVGELKEIIRDTVRDTFQSLLENTFENEENLTLRPEIVSILEQSSQEPQIHLSRDEVWQELGLGDDE